MNRVKPFAVIVALNVILLFVGCNEQKARRLPESAFKVTFGDHQIPSEMKLGKTIQASVNISNSGDRAWPSKPNAKGEYAVNLAYHWLTLRGQVVVYEGVRTPFPENLDPGKSVDLAMTIEPPPRPGKYLLEVTLVQESVAWFPDNGGDKIEVPVWVVADDQEIATVAQAPIKVPNAAAKRNENDSRESVKADLEPGKGVRQSKKPESPVKNVNVAKTQETHQINPTMTWSVQVASFADVASANKRVKGLKDKGHDAYQLAVRIKGKTWYQVRIGRFTNRAEANSFHERLKMSEEFKRSFVTNRQG